MGAFCVSQLFAVWGFRWSTHWAFAPLLVVWLSWLYVGLFIVAHDCMHGSLAPALPGLHRPIGQVCSLLYAGFDYAALRAKHRAHHASPGTADDPDFAGPEAERGLFAWYGRFVTHYLSARQLALLAAAFHVSALSGASLVNLLAFWLVPSLLSSLQLFYFGTYLPHRPTLAPFADDHRARSSAYPAWLSLLSCFHFGYHHEHHLYPMVPWWRLPALRGREIRRAARSHV